MTFKILRFTISAQGGVSAVEWIDPPTGGSPVWGAITGTLGDQTDLQAALDAKADESALGTAAFTDATDYATAAQGATADSALQPAGNGGSLTGLTKTQVGLANVDNTSDANKPVSTATQAALDLKAPLASPTFTGTVSGVTAAMVGAPAGSGNSSGTNTGDNATNSQYSGLAASKQDTLVSATNIKTINGSSVLGSGNLVVGGAGDLVYAPTPADVAINSTTDVTIATKDVTSVAAGDQLIMEGSMIVLNNSGATRNIIVTLDFDAAFDIEITLPALAASTTLMQPVFFRAELNVRSTSLAYMTCFVDMQLAAGIASGTDTSAAATHLSGKGWGTSASNLTGTVTCILKMRSANATATQTCRLVGFTIRKISPVSV